MTRGGGGVQTPPQKDGIIYEQPHTQICSLPLPPRWSAVTSLTTTTSTVASSGCLARTGNSLLDRRRGSVRYMRALHLFPPFLKFDVIENLFSFFLLL